MRARHLILGLILLTLLATCLLAAAKLRATPKYDRIRVGMTIVDVEASLGIRIQIIGRAYSAGTRCETDEGRIVIHFSREDEDEFRVKDKSIERRGPLERLAGLAGWR